MASSPSLTWSSGGGKKRGNQESDHQGSVPYSNRIWYIGPNDISFSPLPPAKLLASPHPPYTASFLTLPLLRHTSLPPVPARLALSPPPSLRLPQPLLSLLSPPLHLHQPALGPFWCPFSSSILLLSPSIACSASPRTARSCSVQALNNPLELLEL